MYLLQTEHTLTVNKPIEGSINQEQSNVLNANK